MEKAKIEIMKSKKGNLFAKIHFENGKFMTLSGFKFEQDLNEKNCEVERIKGKIVNVIVDGKNLERENKKYQDKNKNYYHKNDRNHKNRYPNNRYTPSKKIKIAHAPYNFIPLNKKIVALKKPKSFDKYHDGLNTGYIDIEIETKTPIFIRGKGSDFYKQAGKYRIPGSSLRGMVRTMVEMVSWSEFSFFNNDYLYYRSFADKSRSLREEYIKHMISSDSRGKSQYRMNSGLLYKEGLHYYIIPAKKRFEKIKKSESKRYPNYPGYYGFVRLSDDKYLVVPGKKFKPKDENNQNDWIVYADKSELDKRIKISNDDIFSYKNDSNRKAPDIISKLKKTAFVPCFYVEWTDLKGNKRISFGHTPLFRISYEKNIGEHITQNKPEGIDIAVSIFGNENDFMTRLFFEDAFLLDNFLDKVSEKEKIPKTLSGPKPTSVQLYLEQENVNNVNNLKHYNNDVNIRGNKLYWHKSSSNAWKNDFNPNIDTKIRPIATGAKFNGRIRFENLSDIELGALLFSIDLPEGLAHKIGMGKPLGLGSIRITPKLYISDRKKRYSDILAEWKELNEANEDKVEELKQKFEKFILSKIGEGEKKSLWDTERLKELARMLDFENKPSNDKTEYMRLEQFRERGILPKTGEIL